MKKLIALMLLTVLLLTSLAACGGDPASDDQGNGSGAVSGSSDNTSEGGDSATSGLKVGTYRIENVATGKAITYDSKTGSLTIGQEGETAVGLNIVYVKGERKYVMEFLAMETKKHNDKNVNFENYEMSQALAVDSLKNGIVKVTNRDKGNFQQWTITDLGDGTYTIAPRANSSMGLAMNADSLYIAQNEEATTDAAKWKITNISTENDYYLEYVSDEGNVAVRLPLDMMEKTKITGERVTEWANDIEKVLDAYEELTSFHAQDTIFIHAYNYQGVMAGVIGTDQVYVNCGPDEWFYSDMEKMQKRTELGAHDINFMCLHEIGHLFDYARGWNFESEMTADLKAAYALYSLEGSVAAPAEFSAREYFDYENIHNGYGALGGGRMTKKYSIYRLAELMTDISYEIGWDPFKQTFAWFQSLSSSDYPATRVDKFDTFLAKLDEYSGKDASGMISDAEKKVCRESFES